MRENSECFRRFKDYMKEQRNTHLKRDVEYVVLPSGDVHIKRGLTYITDQLILWGAAWNVSADYWNSNRGE